MASANSNVGEEWSIEQRLLIAGRLALFCYPVDRRTRKDGDTTWAAAVLIPFLELHNLRSGNADFRLAPDRKAAMEARAGGKGDAWLETLRACADVPTEPERLSDAIRTANDLFRSSGSADVVGYVVDLAAAGETPMLRDAYENLQNVWTSVNQDWRSQVPPWWDRFAESMFYGRPFDLALVEDPSGPWVEAIEPNEGNVAQQLQTGGNRRPSLRMLDDAPIEEDPQDTLGFRAYADALAGILMHPDTRMPFVMAINAPWGAGKSSLAKMIEKRLRTPDPVTREPRATVCHYNAWMNDDAKSLAGSFTATVARVAAEARPWYWQIIRPIPPSLMSREGRRIYRVRLLLYALLVLVAVVAASYSASVPILTPLVTYISESWKVPELSKILGASTGLGGLAAAITAALAWIRKLADVGQSVANFAVDPQKSADEGQIGDARDQLTLLIKQATGKDRMFVVFVDDLERCQPPRAIEVLDVINQLLCQANVAVVLLGDMGTVAASAGIKYGGLAEEYDPAGVIAGPAAKQAFGRLYLQKIIQMQFDLPPHRPESIRALMDRLTAVESEAAPKHAGTEVNVKPSIVASGEWPVILGSALILALGWFGGLGLQSIAVQWGNPALGKTLFEILIAISWVIVAAAGAGIVIERVKRKRRGAEANRVIEFAKSAAAAPSTASDATDEAIRLAKEFGLDAEAYRESARQAVREQRMGETDELRDAYAAAIQDMPLLPRNAKRLVNMLRVLIYLARERKLLDDNLTPAHIGRWCAFRERFPDLALRTLRSPSMLDELEREMADGEKFAARLEFLSAPIRIEVHKFLNAEPRLGPVAHILVHLKD